MSELLEKIDSVIGLGFLFSLALIAMCYFLLWPPLKETMIYAATQTAVSNECLSLGYPDYDVARDWNGNEDSYRYYCIKLVDGTSVTIPLEQARIKAQTGEQKFEENANERVTRKN